VAVATAGDDVPVDGSYIVRRSFSPVLRIPNCSKRSSPARAVSALTGRIASFSPFEPTISSESFQTILVCVETPFVELILALPSGLYISLKLLV
jgi:hypothetical protein